MCPSRQTQTHTQITPIGTDTHAGPASPTQGSCAAPASTLEKQNRQPAEPLPFQSPFSVGKKVEGERSGEVPPKASCGPPAPRCEARTRGGSRTYSGDPMARPPLPQPRARLRARHPLRPASRCACSIPTKSRRFPWAGLAPSRPALTSGVLERDIYGKDTLNFP